MEWCGEQEVKKNQMLQEFPIGTPFIHCFYYTVEYFGVVTGIANDPLNRQKLLYLVQYQFSNNPKYTPENSANVMMKPEDLQIAFHNYQDYLMELPQ